MRLYVINNGCSSMSAALQAMDAPYLILQIDGPGPLPHGAVIQSFNLWRTGAALLVVGMIFTSTTFTGQLVAAGIGAGFRCCVWHRIPLLLI